MANVTANVSTVDVTVTSTPSNITVTDVDTSTNITLTSATTNVAVTTTQLEVNVAPLTSVSNSVIRAALSVDDTGGDGSLTYDNIDGIFTYTGPNQDEANARIDGAPANVRAHFSYTTGVANYSPVTGVITIPGDTDDVTEGNTNLFYTDQRVLDKVFEIVSGNTPRYFGWGPGLQIISSGNAASWFLTADTDDIPEGSNLYFTTARVDSHLLSGVNNNVTINGELFVNGNAVVAGNLDYENVTDLYVTDQKITLNANAVTNSNVEIIANRPAATSTSLKWNEDSDTWTFTNDGTTYYPIPTSTTDLAEGNNLYYTNARVLAYIQDNGLDFNAEKVDDRVANLLVSGSANLTYSYDDGANTLTLTQTLTTDDISEGTNQYFTNARVRSAITNGNIVLKQFAETNHSLGITNGNITVDAANGTVQSVVLNGDMTGLDIINDADCTTIQLFITGQFGNEEIDTTTYPSNWSNWYFTDNDTTLASGVGGKSLMIVSNDVNGVKLASVTRFEDPAPIAGNFDSNVVLNFGQTTDEDAYVFAHRPVAGTNVAIRWNETTDKWQFTNDGSTYYDLLTGEVGLGTVTSVTAGAGMTQSGNANVNPTLDVVGGYGITVNADNLEVTNADIQAQANVAFGNNTTDNLTQGTTNLYYSTTLANADIDARVTKTFVDGLGVDYNTLSNLPTIPTHTSNLINDSGFITSATANVISVNGQTGVVTLSTTDVAEGANLYYTTARANSAIDAYVTGGNAITVASGVVSLDNTAVTPGTYGNATHVAQFTVDQQGRLTAVTDVAIAGGAGTYGNANVANFLENGFGSNNIVTTGNITGGYIIAGNDAGGDGYFIGDINGAIQAEVYNASGGTLNKGDIVALNGAAHGDTPDVVLADASNASLMPGFGVVKNSISAGVTGEVVISGKMNFPNSFTVGAQLYVNGVGQFTETQPSGEGNLVQKIAKVVSSTSINVAGAGRTNATPNLDDGALFVGGSSNYAIAVDTTNNFDVSDTEFDLANALSNVNSVTAETGVDFTVNTNGNMIVKQPFGTAQTLSNSAVIAGDGYAFRENNLYTTNLLTYTGTDPLVAYKINGNIVTGSNEITISAVNRYYDDAASSVSDLVAGMSYGAGTGFTASSTGFPVQTYVQSIDAANSKIIMSEVGQANIAFTDHTVWSAIVDTTRNQVVRIRSEYDNSGGSNTSINNTVVMNQDAYGYPSTGFSAGDFDVFAAGTASDYSWDANIANFMVGRTAFTPEGTAPKFINGLVIGENTSLTNRAENDPLESFGINVMWDGISSAGQTSKIPQTLMKSYTDNTLASTQPSSSGPRLFFTSAYGNANNYAFDTYPRANQELGRITWWGTSGTNLVHSSTNPPAFISVLAHEDWDVGGSAAGVSGTADVYMASASDKDSKAQTYLAFKHGKLVLGSGTNPTDGQTYIELAPGQVSGPNNPASVYEGLYPTWAKVNYANVSATSGAALTITHGGSAGAGTVGDQELIIQRNDNGGNQDIAIHSFISAGYLGQSTNIITMRVSTAAGLGSSINGQSVTFSSGIVSSAGGNENALDNQSRWVNKVYTGGGYDWFYLYDDSGLTTVTTYSSLGGSSGFWNITQTGATFETFIASGVTPYNWKLSLPEQSEVLQLQANASTIVEFSSTNVSVTGDIVATGDITATANVGANNVNVTNKVTADVGDFNSVELKQFSETVVALGARIGDFSANINANQGSIFTVTVAGDITINSIANAVAGTSATIILTGDAAGNHTLTSSMKFAGGSKALTAAPNSTDIMSVFYDGSTYYASITTGYA